MGATTMGCSQLRVNCPNTCAGLGAVKVMTASAGKTGPATVAAVSSAGQPEGKSIARMGAVLAFTHSCAAAASPLSGGLKPVPTTASRIKSASSAVLCRARSSAASMMWTSPCGVLVSSRQALAASPVSPWLAPNSSVVTSRPSEINPRAAIMPSPPLLPRPHSTVIRRARGNCSRAKAATAADAARINSSEGTSNRSVVKRSQTCISAAERTCMETWYDKEQGSGNALPLHLEEVQGASFGFGARDAYCGPSLARCVRN